MKPADYCTCQRNRRLRKHMMFVAKHLRDNTLGLVNLDLNVSHLSPRIGHQHARSTRVTRCNPIAPKGFPGFITHVPFPLYIGEPVSFVIDIDWMPSKPTMPVHIRILGCSLVPGILACIRALQRRQRGFLEHTSRKVALMKRPGARAHRAVSSERLHIPTGKEGTPYNPSDRISFH